MKWARLSLVLEKRTAPLWLWDAQQHQFHATEPRGSTITVTKYGGPQFDVVMHPWWGPTTVFLAAHLPAVLNRPGKKSVDLSLVWDAPQLTLLLDDIPVAERTHAQLAEAAVLAVPYSLLCRLTAIQKYRLRKPPEPSEAWEASEFLRYVERTKRLASEEDWNSFLRELETPANATQKLREQLAVYVYAKALERLTANRMHVAILTPLDDRGIDCYIRLIDYANLAFVAVPIQVCDVRVSANDSQCVALQVLDRVRKAKGKAQEKDNAEATLFCNLSSSPPVHVDMMHLRDLFGVHGPWPFHKIIVRVGMDLGTVYCPDDAEHVMYKWGPATLQYTAHIGRTQKDVETNGTIARQGCNMPIII